MSHRNARLTVHGRLLIVQRHRQGWPQAHIAKAMGVSRKCVKTWIDRYAAEGEAGLARPLLTAAHDADAGPAARSSSGARLRRRSIGGSGLARPRARCAGPDGGPDPAPPPGALPAECDPMTGEVIRASKTTAVRYERDRPGELVHMDVKKIGRIPDGGGWRAHGRETSRSQPGPQGPGSATTTSTPSSTTTAGSPTPRSCPTRRAPPAPRSSSAPLAYFADHGITRIERVMTDNAWTYTRAPLRAVVRRARHPPEVHQAPLPLAERQGRTLQPHPADRVGLPPGLHHQRRTHRRPCPLARALQHSTTPQRPRRPTHPSAACHQPDGRVHLAGGVVGAPEADVARGGLGRVGRAGSDAVAVAVAVVAEVRPAPHHPPTWESSASDGSAETGSTTGSSPARSAYSVARNASWHHSHTLPTVLCRP